MRKITLLFYANSHDAVYVYILAVDDDVGPWQRLCCNERSQTEAAKMTKTLRADVHRICNQLYNAR